jgi:hypothetical protein
MHQNPKQWEPSLLEAMLHPFPMQMSTSLWRKLFDWSLMENKDPEKIAKEIIQIGKRHLWSQAFAQRYKKEKKLIEDLERFINKLKPQDLEPYLLEASLLPSSDFKNTGEPWIMTVSVLYKLALRFVREKFGKALSAISSIPEVHYYLVGKILYDLAQERLKDDPDFKAKVEKAAKARKQKQGSKTH